jgi:alkylation response protein AidB-like acyl-CoA dehydrogenase
VNPDVPVRLPRSSPSRRATRTTLEVWLKAQQPLNAGELFRRLVDGGLAELPLPGGGETLERWRCLEVLGSHDLSLARLTEGHADALAILDEAGTESPGGRARLGVWAAGPLDGVSAARTAKGWCLSGVRRWCSGAAVLTHALVTAAVGDCPMLFLVPLDRPGVRPLAGVWQAVGMAESGTDDVEFRDVQLGSESLVGGPNFYLQREGFWLGAVGVAAVWLGGAQGVARALESSTRETSPHRLAHLGAIWARLTWLERGLADVADRVDQAGLRGRELELLARSFRIEVEAGASEVLARTGRATGAEPLGHDRAHARLVADLPVYLRQSHAESDLEALGRLVIESGTRDGD